ncbi:FosA family fosfomycin resistance glutathione transferase [soil metagenome]
MITGVNHLTFSVRDLEESVRFYVEVLGLRSVSRKDEEAHLLAGDTWVALIPDPCVRDGVSTEYTHTAFSVSAKDFAALDRQIRKSGAEIWQENQTQGDSLYFLDPNGHKLEIHASNLEARLESDRRNPPEGMEFYL